MKNIYYNLYHTYEDKELDDDVSKFIGMFSSSKKAKEAIELLRNQPGFKDYPKRCFEICKFQINLYGWDEGFCTWEEAYEYQKKYDDEEVL